jgi:thiamine-phosphate pyrophosphorylase
MFPSLYAILDAELAGGEILSFAEGLASSGVEIIQYRNKSASSLAAYTDCVRLADLLRERSRFIVNDRADVAALCGAGGVHVGQEDLPVDAARAVCGHERWVGISTHNLAQFEAARQTSADYLAVGPIFATATKNNPDPVVGVDFVRRVRPMTSKPIVAIGGITLENAAEVYRAGADSIAVIRDLIAATDPASRARQFLKLANEIRQSQN